ncbi:MAG: alpha/beta hydrolase, partial [Myxococcota bacterium]
LFDRALAASGMLVLALDFRMAPAQRWPVSLEDLRAGMRFVRTHAARLGALVDPIGLIGRSSGGHLVLWAALCPGSSEASAAYALPLWPIADPLARYRYAKARIGEAPAPGRDRFFEPERLVRAQDEYFGDEAAMHDASVPRLLDDGVFERLPPLWVAHPERDENVTLAMTQDWVTKYRARGGSALLEVFAGVGHSFANFPGEATERCIAQMRAFIARQLAPYGVALAAS